MPKLIEPKFKKTPKNRKKDKATPRDFDDGFVKGFSKMMAPLTFGAPLTVGSMVGSAKLGEYREKKKKERIGKKAKPEIKADAAKKGKMIKLKGGGAAIRGTNFKGVF